MSEFSKDGVGKAVDSAAFVQVNAFMADQDARNLAALREALVAKNEGPASAAH